MPRKAKRTTTKPEYIWRNSSNKKGDSDKAQLIGEELDRIRDKHGNITAEIMVQEAEHPLNPLHDDYEWNNEKAGHEHRLSQARVIRCSVNVRTHPGSQHSTQAFVKVKEHDGTTKFESVLTAMSDAEKRAQLLERAGRELEEMKTRYDHLEELASLWPTVSKAVTKVRRKARELLAA